MQAIVFNSILLSDKHKTYQVKQKTPAKTGVLCGAAKGNRTPILSMARRSSTIEP